MEHRERADEHATPAPDDRAEEVRGLVAECVERMEDEGAAAVDEVCRAHPEHADAVRSRLRSLREMGLLPEAEAPDQAFPAELGEFRLIERIGGGGMGVVYRAEQRSLGRIVALKLIRPEHLYFPGSRERFRREIEAVARLQHPGIVPVHSVGEEKGIPFLAMELIAGCTLAEVLRELRDKRPERLRGRDLFDAVQSVAACEEPNAVPALFAGSWVETSLRLASAVAGALDHAHRRGVLHRDVKPSNAMITPDGRVLLLDFGLARTEGAAPLTRASSELGSLPYMPPEQLRGEALDERGDVYSLGVLLYELLALRAPFRAESGEAMRREIAAAAPEPVRRANPAVSWEAATVCATAMDPDPRRRYASAADLARDIDHVLELRPIEARPTGTLLRAQRWTQRHPKASAALVLGFLIVVVGPLAFAVEERAAARRIGKERQRAEQNLAKALQAVDLMLTRVGEEELVPVPQMEEVRRKLLEDALGFYKGFLAEQSEDRALRRETARAHARVGEIQGWLGQHLQAQDAWRDAIALWQGLEREPGGDPLVAAELGRAWRGLATVLHNAERFVDAEQAYRAALDVLPHESPARAMREERARALASLGILCSMGQRYAEAEQVYGEAIADQESLCGEDPADADCRRELAKTLTSRGILYAITQRFEEARESFGLALEAQARLCDEHPRQPRYRNDLSNTRYNLGLMLSDAGRLEEAEHAMRASIAERERLASEFPSVPEYQGKLAANLQALGALCARRSGTEEAETAYRRAVEILERLLREDPALHGHRRMLAFILMNLAKLQHETGRSDAAVEASGQALALMDALVAALPENAEISAMREAARKLRELVSAPANAPAGEQR